MRLSILTTATLGFALFATAVSAAVIPPRLPPNKPTPTSGIMQSCEPGLGMLRTVHKADVMAIDYENTIVIRPVCQDDHLDGNASGLRGIIGRNDVMSMALASENFNANDVIGIQFGDAGVVLLYVME